MKPAKLLIDRIYGRSPTEALYAQVMNFDAAAMRATVRTYNDAVVTVNVAEGLSLVAGETIVLVAPAGRPDQGQVIQKAQTARPSGAQNIVIQSGIG